MSSTTSFIVPPALLSDIVFDQSTNGFEVEMLLNMNKYGVPINFTVDTLYINVNDAQLDLDSDYSANVMIARHTGHSLKSVQRANQLIELGIPAVHDCNTQHHVSNRDIEACTLYHLQGNENKKHVTLQQGGIMEAIRTDRPGPQDSIEHVDYPTVLLTERWT